MRDLPEKARTENKGGESSIALKGILFLIGAILAVVGSAIIFTEIQGTFAGLTDPLSSKFIIWILFLIIGLGFALQITVDPALKRRSIKRQLEDMSVIESPIDNHKARKREGVSSF